MRQIYS